MDLDGARNAKAAILGSIFADAIRNLPDLGDLSGPAPAPFDNPLRRSPSPLSGAIGSLGSLSIAGAVSNLAARLPFPKALGRGASGASGGRARPRGKAMPSVAIGIQRSRRKGATLVLIAPDIKLRTHPLVERAISLAKGEARFVAGGEPRPLSFWQPPRRRPLMLGTSVSHHRIPAGTLGAFVRLADGSIGVLSNNHVLADVNKGKIGDPVVQPGKSDGGKTDGGDTIGTLLRFVPIRDGGAGNTVDCAVAALDPAFAPSAEVVVGHGEPSLRVTGLADDELFANDAVWKVGRTTGLTNGRVFAVEVDNFTVNMGTAWSPFRCRFDGQIQVYAEDRAFAGPGDSGSLLVDHDGLAHALLFAGSATGGPTGTGLATFNPLTLVLRQLDATLWVG